MQQPTLSSCVHAVTYPLTLLPLLPLLRLLQEACDAATADVAREKWLELEVERQRQVADASVEQLSCMERDKKELAKRVKQLEVGCLPPVITKNLIGYVRRQIPAFTIKTVCTLVPLHRQPADGHNTLRCAAVHDNIGMCRARLHSTRPTPSWRLRAHSMLSWRCARCGCS